jgi:hypothetical protein
VGDDRIAGGTIDGLDQILGPGVGLGELAEGAVESGLELGVALLLLRILKK